MKELHIVVNLLKENILNVRQLRRNVLCYGVDVHPSVYRQQHWNRRLVGSVYQDLLRHGYFIFIMATLDQILNWCVALWLLCGLWSIVCFSNRYIICFFLLETVVTFYWYVILFNAIASPHCPSRLNDIAFDCRILISKMIFKEFGYSITVYWYIIQSNRCDFSA